MIEPSLGFHITIVKSSNPLAKSPFGKTASDQTRLVGPVNFLLIEPSSGFHIKIVLSDEPLAKSPFCKTVSERIEVV